MPSNNIDESLKKEISRTINNWLDYNDGNKINLVAVNFNIVINDKYDYGDTLDKILIYCNASLQNGINVLQFINNGFKGW